MGCHDDAGFKSAVSRPACRAASKGVRHEDRRANWLPTPKDGDFSLSIRAYGPRVSIVDGAWTPPPVKQLGEARAVGNGK